MNENSSYSTSLPTVGSVSLTFRNSNGVLFSISLITNFFSFISCAYWLFIYVLYIFFVHLKMLVLPYYCCKSSLEIFLIQIFCQVHGLLIFSPNLCLAQAAIDRQKQTKKRTQTRDMRKYSFQEEGSLEFILERRRVSGWDPSTLGLPQRHQRMTQP